MKSSQQKSPLRKRGEDVSQLSAIRVSTAKRLHHSTVVFPISSFSVGEKWDAGLAAAKEVFHSRLRGLGKTSLRVMAAALPGRQRRGCSDWSSCLTLNTTARRPERQPATTERDA